MISRRLKVLHGNRKLRSKLRSDILQLSILISLSILIEHGEDIPEPQDTSTGQTLYFEVLELQPIKLSLSFMRTERVSSEEK